MNNLAEMDFPMESGEENTTVRRKKSAIDISLGVPAGGKTGFGADRITDAELELVNRHHAEVKELHRRARQGE